MWSETALETIIETRPCAAADLAWLDTVTPQGWFSASALQRVARPLLSVSYYAHDTYLGSSGLYPLWHGVYEAWLVLQVPPPSGWAFVTQVRAALARGESMTQAHRLQAYCLAEYMPGLVLARRLGFVPEGILRQATPTKTDLVVLGKVL